LRLGYEIRPNSIDNLCDTFPDEPALTGLAADSIVEDHLGQDLRHQDLQAWILVLFVWQEE
jgi:hypothetical protein